MRRQRFAICCNKGRLWMQVCNLPWDSKLQTCCHILSGSRKRSEGATMRQVLLALVVLGSLLAPVRSAQAGLYNTEAPLFRAFPTSHQQFQAILSELRG